VDGWRLDVVTDPATGLTYQKEIFAGQEKMKVKGEQMYLGDLVSAVLPVFYFDGFPKASCLSF
jgi:hypothetical protein